jgi:hypothetical protein
MLHLELSRFINRELNTLRDELLAYPEEAAIWARPIGLPNSAGTLALHLCGNLRWYIGAQYGATGYIRDRDKEFSDRGVPREELLRLIAAAADEVTRTFATLDPALLDKPYPIEVAGQFCPAHRFFLHLTVHLGYHLGQVDYHRRVVTGSSDSVGAIPSAVLVP